MARAGPGHRRPGSRLPPAARGGRHPARRESLGRGVLAPAARGAGCRLGGVAVPPGRRPARAHGGCAPLGDPLGHHDVRPGARRRRRVGGRAARRRGRRGAAALAGARGARLRGPGGRPAVAGGLALRPPARGGHRLHAGGLAPRARARGARRGRGVPAAAERDGRPVDLGAAARSPWRWSRSCWRRGGCRR